MGCFEFLPRSRDTSEGKNRKHHPFEDRSSVDVKHSGTFSNVDSQPVSNTSGQGDVVVEVAAVSVTVGASDSGEAESSPGSTKLEHIGSLRKPNDLRDFTFQELRYATKNFNRQHLLGEGGFGQVFKGSIRHKQKFGALEEKVDVAVKQLNSRGQQGHKEWLAEVHFLGLVDSPYLVKLIGYCASDDDERGIQRLLVYEYMPNKGLDDHLFLPGRRPLSWPQRVKIALGAARGLAYLHEEMEIQVIFRDFKTSNVLLDEELNPKLSDFGLARQGPQEGNSHVSTAVVGTAGYAAPEYIQTGHLTSKSDVWSFGIVMLEMLTGRRVMDRNRPKNEQRLVEWVRPHINDHHKFAQIVDPHLEGKYPLRPALKFAQLATQCLTKLPKGRPKMSEVVERLKHVLERTYQWECPTPQSPSQGSRGTTVEGGRPGVSVSGSPKVRAAQQGLLPSVESGKLMNFSPSTAQNSDVSGEIGKVPKTISEMSLEGSTTTTSSKTMDTSAENSAEIPTATSEVTKKRSWGSDRLSRMSRDSGRFTWIPKLSFSSQTGG